MTPTLAIVVPTRDRAGRIDALLAALAAQTVRDLEVVVVVDGGTDPTPEVVASWRTRLDVRCIGQAHAGAGAARNRGVAATTGEIVLFLDDDVVPVPTLVEAHLRRHDGRRAAVVGDCPMVRRPELGPHHLDSWAWWSDFNVARAAPDAPRTYRDVCSGNLSVRREDLLAVGGFDERFVGYGYEDWELGHRLLRDGVEVVVAPGAVAWHHQAHSTRRLLANRRAEGRGEVLFGRLHPELRGGLRVLDRAPERRSPQVRDAFVRPQVVRSRIEREVARMALSAPLGLSKRWRGARHRAFEASFWLGVADELHSWEALLAFAHGAPPAPRATIDLRDGLPEVVPLPVEVAGVLEVVDGPRRLGEVPVPAFTSRRRRDVAQLLVDHLDGALLRTVAAPA